MMGIGMWELIVIGGVALVFIGPEKFPDFAKIVIRTVRDLRGYVDDVKSEVVSEINPLKKEMNRLSRIDPEKYIDALVGKDDDEEGEEDDVEEAADEEEGVRVDPYFEYTPSGGDSGDATGDDAAGETAEKSADEVVGEAPASSGDAATTTPDGAEEPKQGD